MSWGLVVMGGAAIGGALINSNASSKAADAQIEATEKGQAIQEQRFNQATDMQAQKEQQAQGFLSNAASQAEQSRLTGQNQAMGFQQQGYDQSLGFTQPYRQAGGQALQDMQNLTTDAGRGQALQDYYGGEEFGALAEQREEQALRMGAATGGVRGGNTQAALANIAPQLGQQHLANQYGQLAGLSSMGANMSSQAGQNALGFGGAQAGLAQGTQNAIAGDRLNLGSQQAQNAMNTGINYGNQAMGLGQNLSALQQQSGQAQAQNSLTQGGIFSNLMSGLGGMAGGGGGFVGSGGGGGGGGINYGGGYKNDNYLI